VPTAGHLPEYRHRRIALGPSGRNAAEPQFFRPESAALEGAQDAPPERAGTPVRLRPVQGTPFLRERIAWRASSVEFGLYEQRRWTELPASFVERALETTLRRTPGIQLTDAPRTAMLRVEVVAFDEVLAPGHVAAVSLAVSLEDGEQRRLLDRTFSVEEPITGEAPAATATAMGKALDTAVAEVAGAVGDALRAR
jgi:ABC-type uncharacterized transport system auxiliary subunit